MGVFPPGWLWALGGLFAVIAVVAVLLRQRQVGDRHGLDVDSLLDLARRYLDSRRFMEAMVVSKKAIKLAPEDPRGEVMLARVYLAQGKTQKAERIVRQVLRVHPSNGEAVRLAAEIERAER